MSGLFGSAATSSSSANSTTGDISKDVALTAPPDDGISDLSFSSQSDHLAIASWDKKVRIYEINAQGGSEGKALYEHEGPVLSCCWSKVSLHRLSFPTQILICMLGRPKSSQRRRRQSRPSPRPRRRRHRTTTSSRTRSTHPLRAHDRRTWPSNTSPRNRILGQNSQILGSANPQPRRNSKLSRPRLHHRQQEQPPRHRHRRSLHQYCQSGQTHGILQDYAITAEMADTCGDMLLRRFWLRSRLHRRSMRDTIRRRKRLPLEFQLQMPSLNTTKHPRRQQRLLRKRHIIPPSPRYVQHRGLRRDVPFLGQGCETPIEGVSRSWRNDQQHGFQ